MDYYHWLGRESDERNAKTDLAEMIDEAMRALAADLKNFQDFK